MATYRDTHIQNFIKDNRKNIQTLDFDTVYVNADQELSNDEVGTMTEMFLTSGIDVLAYLKEEIPAGYLWGSDIAIDTIKIPEHIVTIRLEAFSNTSNIRKVIMHDNVTVMGSGVFNTSNVEEVVLSKGLINLPRRTFEGCNKLRKIIIPDGYLCLRRNSFYRCSELEEVVLPDSLEDIREFAFFNCPKLKFLRLPDNISRISPQVFDKDITIECKEGSYAHEYCIKKGIKHVTR